MSRIARVPALPCSRTLPRSGPSLGLRAATLILLLGVLRPGSDASAEPVTNLPQAAATNAPPGVTNLPPDVTHAVPAATNAPPAVTNLPPARTAPIVTGATLMGVFGDTLPGGKFAVSGRTLTLPAPPLPSAPVPADAWRRSLAFGMTLAQGNTEILRYSLGLDVLKEREIDLFRMQAQGRYGESADKTDTENAMASLRYERMLTAATYALGNVEWMTDSIAEIDHRLTCILSPGIHLIRTDTTLLSVEAGAGYVSQKKRDNEEGYAAGRLAVTAERLINDHVLVWAGAEYLPKIAEASVFYVNSNAGLATLLARNLSLNVTIQNRYDNAPAEDKKKSDTVLTTSLNLNF